MNTEDWQEIPESDSILPITYIPIAHLEKVLSFIAFLNFWHAKVKRAGNLGVLEVVQVVRSQVRAQKARNRVWSLVVIWEESRVFQAKRSR